MVNDWFENLGETEVSPLEKPLDTIEHERKRLQWVRKYFNIITSRYIYVCCFDEIFYAISLLKKTKKLPRGLHQVAGSDKIVLPKIMSRRFPIKSVFLGVVG